MQIVKGPDNQEPTVRREAQAQMQPQEARARLTRMVETYQVPLLRMCVIWLRDSQQAQDAVQETFLKAYEALPRFRGECQEKTWLMRIAVNVCRDMRKTAWFRMVDRRVTPDMLPEPSADYEPEDDTLFRAVWKLPARQREAVLLYYYQDMKLEEIAKVLSVAPSTVSRRIAAATDTLRKELKGA